MQIMNGKKYTSVVIDFELLKRFREFCKERNLVLYKTLEGVVKKYLDEVEDGNHKRTV